MKKYLLPLALSTLLATGSAAFAVASANPDTVKIFNNTATPVNVGLMFSGTDMNNSCHGANQPCASITPAGTLIPGHSSQIFTIDTTMTKGDPIYGAVGFDLSSGDGSDSLVTLPVVVTPYSVLIRQSEENSIKEIFEMGAVTSSTHTANPAFISSVVYFNDNGQTSTTVIVNDNPMAQKA